MTRLLSFALFSGLTVGLGLVVMDSARFTVAEVNKMQEQKCLQMNHISPGSCIMPTR